MSHRFFLNTPPTDASIRLAGDQAHHAIHVMRFKIGDEIILFDGSGTEHTAIIESIGKKQLDLNIIETISCPRQIRTSLTLAVALPKGDRQKFLVEKLVELGVNQLIPLTTNRSVAVANTKVIERLQKQVVEASKQCGRNTLMIIEPSHTLEQLADIIPPSTTQLIANPYLGKPISAFIPSDVEPPQPVFAIIGPEGGFDESEHGKSLELGFEPVRLGPAILRVETAALALAAILGIGRENPVERPPAQDLP